VVGGMWTAFGGYWAALSKALVVSISQFERSLMIECIQNIKKFVTCAWCETITGRRSEAHGHPCR
jgi:hypothetical protein